MELVGGVVEVLVVELAAVFGFEVLDIDVVDLACLERFQIDGDRVGFAFCSLGDGDCFFSELATSILERVLVMEGVDADLGLIQIGHGQGGGELEAGFGELDLLDIERCLAGKTEPLNALGGFAPAPSAPQTTGRFAPATYGLADVELFAIGRPLEAVVACPESRFVDEVGAAALQFAADFVEHDTGNAGTGIVSNDELAWEDAKSRRDFCGLST